MTPYDYRMEQVSGPGWMESERYDITAVLPEGVNREQFKAMLQYLLKERFKLALHHETKEMDTYTLVEGKRGFKVKEAADQQGAAPPGAGGRRPAIGFVDGRMHIASNGQTMEWLANLLERRLRRTVADETGLKESMTSSWNLPLSQA